MREGVSVSLSWNKGALTEGELSALLRTLGDLLPVPLTERVDIDAYAEKLLARADICIAVANGSIVGLQALYANDRQTLAAYLPFIAILPEYQRRGLGRTMLGRAVALCRERGMQRLNLASGVNRENVEAQALYRSFGFRVVAEVGAKLKMSLDLTYPVEATSQCATPLQRAPKLAAVFGLDIDLRIKRDDLYPVPGGGTKGRKMAFIAKRAIADGYDVLVTNGAPQSNHARAAAVLAAELGLQCHLVIVVDPAREYRLTGNLLLMKLSGASMEYCKKEELAERMQQAVERLAAKGHRPLYVWGGGHCLEGTLACVAAAREAITQSAEWQPDFVVAASGTGTTQAGLAIGYAGTSARVIGVSVARLRSHGQAAVEECVSAYARHSGLPTTTVHVDFRDEWIDGGYEGSSDELFQVIENAARTGVFVCPTYAGKALRGLVDLTRRGEIKKGSNVLFWHTGGLLNLQAVDRYSNVQLSAQSSLLS